MLAVLPKALGSDWVSKQGVAASWLVNVAVAKILAALNGRREREESRSVDGNPSLVGSKKIPASKRKAANRKMGRGAAGNNLLFFHLSLRIPVHVCCS